MSEHKQRIDKERGVRASQILNDPLVEEAFEKIRARLLESWENSHAHDEEIRQNAYLMIRLLKDLEHQFKIAIQHGKLADINLSVQTPLENH